MRQTVLLTGDINLMNVTDPAVPFRPRCRRIRGADVVFSNMECCLYPPPAGHAVENEGFFAAPDTGGRGAQAGGHPGRRHRQQRELRRSGDHGPRSPASMNSAFRIPAPAPTAMPRTRRSVLERNGVRYRFPAAHVGLLADQSRGDRTHRRRRGDQGPHRVSVAAAQDARPEIPPCNRPGLPPVILTWADAAYLTALQGRRRGAARAGATSWSRHATGACRRKCSTT